MRLRDISNNNVSQISKLFIEKKNSSVYLKFVYLCMKFSVHIPLTSWFFSYTSMAHACVFYDFRTGYSRSVYLVKRYIILGIQNHEYIMIAKNVNTFLEWVVWCEHTKKISQCIRKQICIIKKNCIYEISDLDRGLIHHNYLIVYCR